MNPNDVMKYGHFHFLRALEDLPHSDWETGGVCGIWSVKNIVCHIASYEVFMDEMLVKILGDSQPTPCTIRWRHRGQRRILPILTMPRSSCVKPILHNRPLMNTLPPMNGLRPKGCG